MDRYTGCKLVYLSTLGVSIIEEKGNRSTTKHIVGIVVSSVDVGCNKRQISASSCVKLSDNGRNNELFELSVSDNGASQH